MARTRYGEKQTETLNYMQAMLGQLGMMARAQQCDMLAYLIEMAYVEANDIVHGQRPVRVASGKASRRAHE